MDDQFTERVNQGHVDRREAANVLHVDTEIEPVGICRFNEGAQRRCAQKIVAFKAAHPNVTINDSAYAAFISAQQIWIEANKTRLWLTVVDSSPISSIRLKISNISCGRLLAPSLSSFDQIPSLASSRSAVS